MHHKDIQPAQPFHRSWILYDTSNIMKEHYATNNVSGAILTLFVDIVNLFLFILRIVGGRK